ncbi:MAG: hypothetical protein H6R20_203, partial [Proteobacteria bacterium]|nr:hypothetical protein [Pseudomonadota bacterium]
MKSALSGIFNASASRFSTMTTRGMPTAVVNPVNTRNASAAGTPQAMAARYSRAFSSTAGSSREMARIGSGKASTTRAEIDSASASHAPWRTSSPIAPSRPAPACCATTGVSPS